MPLIFSSDHQLLLPDGVRANLSHVLEPAVLWLPEQRDLICPYDDPGYLGYGTFNGQPRAEAPMGLALEHNSSTYYHRFGTVSKQLAEAECITAGLMCRVRQTSSGSPYRHPIVTSENTAGGTSGFGFYFGTGGYSTRYYPAVRDYDATGQYWRGLSGSENFDVNAWYLLLYCRGPDDPAFGSYGPAHRFLVWQWGETRWKYDTAWPNVNRTPFGGEGNYWSLGSYSDASGYCYAQASMFFISPTPYVDLIELATNIFDLFEPRRERYWVPSYGGSWVGTGGITFGGSATVSFVGQAIYNWTGQGGITFGGSAAQMSHAMSHTGAGGVAFSGTAQATLQKAIEPYELGAIIELVSTQTYEVTATLELDAWIAEVTATFELRPWNTYDVACGFTLYADAGDESQEATVLWQPYIEVGGVDISARIVDEAVVDLGENASPVASFNIAPTSGAVDPTAYLNSTVAIWFRHMTDPATERYRRLLFTGKVLSTDWDADTAVLSVNATGDLQTKFDRMDAESVRRSVGGYWSPHIFSESSVGWQLAEDVLATTENVVWQDEAGNIRYTSIRAKASPDYTFTDAGRFHESLRISNVAQRDIINKITVTLDYRFPRKRHRQVGFSWMPYAQVGYAGAVCEFLEDPYTLCTRGMVESAADGGGWVLQGVVKFVDVWPAGIYMCGFANSEPRVWGFEDVQITTTIDTPGNPKGTYTFKVEQDFSEWCIGASWKAAKRWVQSVTETYTLVVQAPQLIERIGVAESSESYGVESEASYDDWPDSLGQSGPPTGAMYFTLPSGDTAMDGAPDDASNRAAMETAQETVIAAARGDILRNARKTTVEFEIPYHASLTLEHTVRVAGATLTAQGKVARLEHRLNVATGEATTKVSLAVSRRLGTGAVTDSPIAAADQAPAPTDPAFPKWINLATHIGGRTTSPAEQEEWTGFFTDYQYDPTATPDWSANPANKNIHRYGHKFVVVTPDIDGEWVDAQVTAETATYDVAVPNDELTITAP